MKLIRLFILAIIIAISLQSLSAIASTGKVLIWYPGEAGTTEQAQPVIDQYFKYLSDTIAPDVIQGKYFNTVEGGRSYIDSNRPVLGIVSLYAWSKQLSRLGSVLPVFATLPLPAGTPTDQYVVVAMKGAEPSKIARLIMSEPLDAQFIKDNIFPKLPPETKLERSGQMLFMLKKIADGSEPAKALLTPAEASTLSKISSPWTQNIQIVERSQPVPTAYVVVFDPTWPGISNLKTAMLKSGSDPMATDILAEMRLKGFAELKK